VQLLLLRFFSLSTESELNGGAREARGSRQSRAISLWPSTSLWGCCSSVPSLSSAFVFRSFLGMAKKAEQPRSYTGIFYRRTKIQTTSTRSTTSFRSRPQSALVFPHLHRSEVELSQSSLLLSRSSLSPFSSLSLRLASSNRYRGSTEKVRTKSLDRMRQLAMLPTGIILMARRTRSLWSSSYFSWRRRTEVKLGLR